MTAMVQIDERDITITPVFMMMEIENVPKSETAGHKVMEMHEVVQIRFAGSKHYSPIFPAHEMYKRDGLEVITHAERWAEQYRSFKEGNPQEAAGTPLEMLRAYGVTPEQLSLCRALRIYSVEALDAMEGPAVKSLGMHANAVREAARKFLAARQAPSATADEIAALRAEIEALKAERAVPQQDSTPEDIDAALAAADAAYADLSDDQIKERIAHKLGSKPRGNPSRSTLESILREAEAA